MRAAVVLSLVTFALALPVAAEQPDWDAIADRVLAVRSHELLADPTLRGLWAFEPDTGEWERLRYFVYNADPGVHGLGRGAALAAADGLVVFQAWPANLELEPGTFRVVRRTSPIADPAAVGLALQGPVVGAREAELLGLEPGTYGIALCRIMGSVGFEPRECPLYSLPDGGLPLEYTDEAPWPLLRRDEAGRLELVALLPALDYDPHDWGADRPVPTLSLDLERRAFWRGTPHGVELVAIEDGVVGQPTDQTTFTFWPFDHDVTTVETFFFHPRREQLFLTTPDGAFMIWLDDSLDPLGMMDVLVDHERAPIAVGSLGEQPATYEQLVPAVAHTEGRNGTFWTSELWLYNPSAQPATVQVRRVAASTSTSSLELPGHGSTRIADVLSYLGGGPEGDGAPHDALVLTSPYRWGEQVVAASRTSTAEPEGGTYGHAVTAAPGRTGYSNHLVYAGEPEPEWMVFTLGAVPYAGASTLYADKRVPGRFRHNLGVVNDSDDAVTLTLLWGHMQEGEELLPDVMALRPASALQSLEVAPHSVRVLDLEALFPEEVTGVWPPRIAVWGSRPVALWMSMVDNTTGDPTFVPYSCLHWGTDLWGGGIEGVRAAVPVVAHAAGAGGTVWQTDVYGVDWLLDSYVPVVWLHPRDKARDCGGAALVEEIGAYLDPEVAQPPDVWPDTWGNWGTVQRDVARAFCPCATDENLQAGFELLSADWLTGWSRTFTTRADGGTYGDMLPFYPVDGWPVQHFAGVEVGSTFRVNVGLFNGNHHQAVTHRLTLYAADGQKVAERTLTLEPLASLQRRLEHLFLLEVGALPAGTYGLTVLPLDDPERDLKGRSWAWVSLVDEVTGDPTNWW